MSIHFEIFQYLGRRERQEDYAAILPQVSVGSEIVAAAGVFDGVGGQRDGHMAAMITGRTLDLAVVAQLNKMDGALDITAVSDQAIRRACEALTRFRGSRRYADIPEEERPAAVGVTAILTSRGELAVCSVGDAVVVLEQRGVATQINEPDLEYSDTGASTASRCPASVTRYLGQGELSPHILNGILAPGPEERLWLMSDGAWEGYSRRETEVGLREFFECADDSMFWDNATAIALELHNQRMRTATTASDSTRSATIDISSDGGKVNTRA